MPAASSVTEVLTLVDHLIAKGAVAIEVTHKGTSVKANLEPRGAQAVSTPFSPDDEDAMSPEDREAARIMNESVYFRDNDE